MKTLQWDRCLYAKTLFAETGGRGHATSKNKLSRPNEKRDKHAVGKQFDWRGAGSGEEISGSRERA